MSLKPPIAPTTAAGSSSITSRLDDLEDGGGVVIRVAAPTGVAATDRAAIAAAIAEANALGGDGSNVSGNATVQFQHGHYRVASGFDLTGLYKLSLVGAGIMSTFIELTGTGHLFYGTATSPSTDGRGRIAHMALLGNASSGNGIDFGWMNPEWLFERLYIREFTDGVKFSNCYENELHHVRAASCRGWGFNFHRQNDKTAVVACSAASCSTGGFRVADGFEGPILGGSTQSCPIGLLIEHSANAGTGDYALMHGVNVKGLTIEGDGAQTQGVKITSAVATAIHGISLDMEIVSGTGTLLEADGCDGLHGFIHTYGSGSPATTKHIDLKSGCLNSLIMHTWKQAAAETTFADAGTNNLRLDKDGFNVLKSYANISAYAAKGDANAQLTLVRSGTSPYLQLGPGGGSALDTFAVRRGGAGFVAAPMLVKAGAPVDGDYVTAPANGTIAVNSSTNKVYCRIGGVWTQVTA